MRKTAIILLCVFGIGMVFLMLKSCQGKGFTKAELQEQVDSLITKTIDQKVLIDEQTQLYAIAQIRLKACEGDLNSAKTELLKSKTEKKYNEKDCKNEHESNLLEDSIDRLPANLANQLLAELEGIEDIDAANQYIKNFLRQHSYAKVSKPNR